MNTSCCRAKILVEYFGEDFSHQKCQLYVKFGLNALPFCYDLALIKVKITLE